MSLHSYEIIGMKDISNFVVLILWYGIHKLIQCFLFIFIKSTKFSKHDFLLARFYADELELMHVKHIALVWILMRWHPLEC